MFLAATGAAGTAGTVAAVAADLAKRLELSLFIGLRLLVVLLSLLLI